MSSLYGPMNLNSDSDSDSDDEIVPAVDMPAAVAAATAAQKREQLKAGICDTAIGSKRQRHSSNMPHSKGVDTTVAVTTALPALGLPESSPCRLRFDSVRFNLAGAEPEGPGRAALLLASEVGDGGEEVEEELEVVDGVEVDASTNFDHVPTIAVELPPPAGPTTIGDNASQGSSVALRGGRKRGAASDALGSALDGGAWQLQQQRVGQQRVGRVERSRLQTIRFEAGAAPSPSALHAEARAKARAARRTQAA